MDVLSEAAAGAATYLKWNAERLAGTHFPRPRARVTIGFIPPLWTAWLLMEKAGVPRVLIARLWEFPEAYVSLRMGVATFGMMWPPYAAHVERMSAQMPRFQKVKGQSAGTAKGAACVVRG
jgi:hypothetical protein